MVLLVKCCRSFLNLSHVQLVRCCETTGCCIKCAVIICYFIIFLYHFYRSALARFYLNLINVKIWMKISTNGMNQINETDANKLLKCQNDLHILLIKARYSKKSLIIDHMFIKLGINENPRRIYYLVLMKFQETFKTV